MQYGKPGANIPDSVKKAYLFGDWLEQSKYQQRETLCWQRNQINMAQSTTTGTGRAGSEMVPLLFDRSMSYTGGYYD